MIILLTTAGDPEAFYNLIHEFQDAIDGQVGKVIIAKLTAESILNEGVGSDCIFLEWMW